MPSPEHPPLTRAVVLRGLGFGVAIALGALAVWLIVIADSTKSMRLGVLAGIWGALLGAYSMFGSRRHGLDLAEPQQRSVSDVPVMSAQEIAVRSTGEVERIAEAAARRAFEDRLEQMMRRELSREVGDLRSEIARLRQDLLDKVGGQLRLERIETTRVIGSDLEALQHEVRQLKLASETGTLHEFGIGVAPLRQVVEPARVRPVSRPTAEAEADVKPARAVDETPAPVRPVENPVGTTANGAPASGAAVNGAPASGAAANGAAANGAAVNEAAVNGAPVNGASANRAPVNGARVPTAATPTPTDPTPAVAAQSERVAATPARATSQAETSRRAEAVPPPSAGPAEAPAQSDVPGPAETTGPIGPPLQRPAQPQPARTAQAQAPTAQTPAPQRQPSQSRPPQNQSAETPAQPAKKAAAPAPPTPQPPAAPSPASDDPFASLPRITPFTAFELDPIETPAPPSPVQADSAVDTEDDDHDRPQADPSGRGYTGRRRRTDEEAQDAGRHSRFDAVEPPATPGGRRRRRADDEEPDDADLLSRLLARDSAEH